MSDRDIFNDGHGFRPISVAPRRPPPSVERLKLALSLAVCMLSRHEPPDSRAVSDEFVALASVDCGDDSPAVMAVIDTALRGMQQ